ncbi:MAG: polysaccharide biosynthesis tyrosine autokinase [Ferruginibacter sp.]
MQQKQNKLNNQKEEGSVVMAMTKYLPYWPLFMLFFLLSMGGAYLYLHYTIPKYEANATIIIKDEKKGADDSKLIGSLDLINSKKIIENEVEVLQSRELMNTVVNKLNLYASVYQEGNVNNMSAYTYSPLKIEAINPDSIQGFEKISLQYDSKTGTVLLNNSFRGPVDQWLNTPFGTLKFLHNNNYSPGAVAKPLFFSLSTSKYVAAGILAGLKVAPSNKLSSVITLSYRDEVPKRAEDILNQLLASYADAALGEKNTLAKNTLAFIEERLRIVKRDLDSIEGKLQRYKSGQGAVDISKQGQIFLETVSATDKKLSDINMQIDVMDQLEKYASSPGSIGVLPSTLGVNDPSLTQQMNNLSTLQTQYEKLKGTVAENHPNLVAISNQINQIRPTILSNIQSLRKNLEQSRGNLNSTSGTYTSMLTSIPEKEKQLVEISRDQIIKNGIYSFLLQKREESELSYASTIPDSRIVNYAQSTGSPVSPKRVIIYMMAVAIAFGFPIAFISARETFSGKILYRQEIESLTKFPVVGEIAFNKSKQPLVVEAGKRTVIAEEFRKIRVSLLSLGINEQNKKILVTSSIAGEGKSFVAANLASSISLTGKKVVLVDMDLHNPGIGKIFGIKEQVGVSDYLMGKKDLKQIIYSIPGNENLFYISSGNLQQDSSELLENGKVQRLIASLDNDFDTVIIDSAPIVLITDAYLLSSLCDATLYVVRHKFTPKVLVKRMDENIAINPIKNPGIIFNGVKTRGFFKNNYGYGYNYVYSYDNKKKKKSFS